MDCSKALLELRAKTNWNQAELADKLELSQTMVSAIERGTRVASKTVALKIKALLTQYGIIEAPSIPLDKNDLAEAFSEDNADLTPLSEVHLRHIFEYFLKSDLTIPSNLDALRSLYNNLLKELKTKEETIKNLNDYIAVLKKTKN